MDKIIEPTVVLLILSLITEKISNFIKLQYEGLCTKHSNILEENLRGKKIQKLTILIGIFVALISKVNFFELFQEGSNLFWDRDDIKGIHLLENILGSVISGLFLSLGSRFFHDLLDILLEVKNLKRKVSDRANWDFENVKEIDDYLQRNDQSEIKTFLNNSFEKIKGYQFYELNYEDSAIKVYVNKGTTGISNMIPYKGANGKVKIFKVDIIESAEIKALSTNLKPSDEIANQYPYLNYLKGSLGLPVYRNNDKKQFILTCYHAVWNKDHNWDVFIPVGKEDVVSPLNGSAIGKIKFAFKNSDLDVALIEPNEDVRVDSSVPLLTSPKSIRSLDLSDKQKKTILKIKSLSNHDQPTVGYVHDIDVTANIKYPDGIYRKLNNLIHIKSFDNTPFSVSGDSGALVLDEWDYAVGIIVAGNDRNVSFAMPISTIFESLNLKLN